MTYDAMVVGAGHNGLVTACYRQAAGALRLRMRTNTMRSW
jgi:hypothetical protein